MKYILLLLSLPALMQDGCKKKNQNSSQAEIPTCIQQKIDSLKKEPKWMPPAQIDEFIYNGKTVYLFNSDCCDHFNIAVDTMCQYVCAPSGGFTGRGEGCADFEKKAKHIRLVWKDAR
ncbi:MAG TPA: hypothetical protein VFZ42_06400 [Chitinophagaceae bacterium]